MLYLRKTIIVRLTKRKVKTVLMATLVLGLTAGLTACGESEEVQVEAATEEHPASEEHPATTEDEHPASEDEHPSE